MDRVECIVIGAGVIGLAVARRLARQGREVIVLEETEGIGTVTSSRNSEVIHAGIYYKAGSLMARTCVAGKQLLYRYCADHGVPHKNCGKLIVATTAAEAEKLQSIRAHAEANGVLDMQTLSGEAAAGGALAPSVLTKTTTTSSAAAAGSSQRHCRNEPAPRRIGISTR